MQTAQMQALKRHVAAFGIAIALVILVFAIALAMNATRTTVPPFNPAEVMVGAVAICFSLPLLAVPILFASRRRLRRTWRDGEASVRAGLAAYLVIEAAGAVVAWTAFILIATRH